jgi:hypothetical protein
MRGRQMHPNDFLWLQSAVAKLAAAGRVSVVGRDQSFTLHLPVVELAEGCDFLLTGKRRFWCGEERSWRMTSYPIGKVLKTRKNCLILQDIWGNVLTLTAKSEVWV